MMNKSLALLSLLLLCSCAASYKPIVPARLDYDEEETDGRLGYSFRTNILEDSGNKRYAQRGVKKEINLIAVKIENKSDKPIVFRRDIRMYAGNRPVYPIDPRLVGHSLKQPAPLYFIWSLLWVVIYKCEGDDCTTIPLPVGLVIGLGNFAVANTANEKFLNEIDANNIFDKEIAPGGTAYGIIGLSAKDISSPLKMVFSPGQ